MKLLVHSCCAPCVIAVLEALKRDGLELSLFFYNPNIQPFLEFRKRIKGMRVLLQREKLAAEIIEEFGFDTYAREIYDPDSQRRCEKCYRVRLTRTARHAAEQGFPAFTTTLLGSTRQNHELIKRVGRETAAEAGVQFFERDFRPFSEAAHEEARRRGIYLQAYCGCCISEYERYRHTTREVYLGGES